MDDEMEITSRRSSSDSSLSSSSSLPSSLLSMSPSSPHARRFLDAPTFRSIFFTWLAEDCGKTNAL